MTVSLKTIILCNFKSFRGKVVIELNEPFTAIVGQNGQGKSNIMDAISFATGETNPVTLRVKRLSELIYGGHVSRPLAQSAFVSLVLTLNDNVHINFTRAITTSKSEYKIDNQTVSRVLYMENLESVGLDGKTKNFLVFQGASENLAMMNPKERTKLLEEVSKSLELKSDYERLRDEQQKLETDVKHMNRIKKYFKAKNKEAKLEKEEAETYKELEKEYVEVKTELSMLQLFQIKTQTEDLQVEGREKYLQIQQYENYKNQIQRLVKERKHAIGNLSCRCVHVEQQIAKAELQFAKERSRFTTMEENASYLQEKVNCYRLSATKARTAYERHKDIIRDLEEELMEVETLRKMCETSATTPLSSQESATLEASQINDYNRLKCTAYKQSTQYVALLDSLKLEQSSHQYQYDNEDRKKMEFEDQLKRKKTAKKEAMKRLEVLENNVQEAKSQLLKEIDFRCKAKDKINEYTQTQEELEKVSRELDEAYVDMKIVSQNKARAKTIQVLQSRFSGIYGRLSEICTPSHPRYNTAANAVLRKYLNAIVVSTQHIATQCIAYLKQNCMTAETFLPIDHLKVPRLKETLRSINNGTNVKLVYDILMFSPPEIAPVILFVTKNTLVCDNPEDASMIAYGLAYHQRQNCVSLDGTFYRKDGTFSGGRSDLSKKVTCWEESKLNELKSQKTNLLQRSRESMKYLETSSDVKTADIRIKSLTMRIKFMETDLESSRTQVCDLDKEICDVRSDLKAAQNVVALIRAEMDARQQKMRDVKMEIKAIEDAVFSDFCERIGVANVRQFEGGELWEHEERTRKLQEVDNHSNRIINQLEYERQRDTQGRLTECQQLVREAELKLKAACEERDAERDSIVNAEREVQALKTAHMAIEKEIDEENKDVGTYICGRGKIARLTISAQKELAAIFAKMDKLSARSNNILKNCKIEGIDLPQFLENTIEVLESPETTARNSSDIMEKEILPQLNFSRIVDCLGESVTGDTVQDSIDKLVKKLADVQCKIKSINKPNLKASDKLIVTMNQLTSTSKQVGLVSKIGKTVKAQFLKVKTERYDRFIQCLNRISAEVGSIYKDLVNDKSAQAILMAINPEEPYLDGIKFGCIPPGKRFQELSNLSGGEKALASLALMFATYSCRIPPFVVLDEADAALDRVNVKYLADHICSKSNAMQFITISLQDETVTHADLVIGVAQEFDGERSESRAFMIWLIEYY